MKEQGGYGVKKSELPGERISSRTSVSGDFSCVCPACGLMHDKGHYYALNGKRVVTIFQHVVKHTVDEQPYEIKTRWTGTSWQVSIWDQKLCRIGPVYSVTLETAQDAEAYGSRPALEALIEIAVSDLDSGRVKSTASPKNT